MNDFDERTLRGVRRWLMMRADASSYDEAKELDRLVEILTKNLIKRPLRRARMKQCWDCYHVADDPDCGLLCCHPRAGYQFADEERQLNGTCGPDGRHWKKKEEG